MAMTPKQRAVIDAARATITAKNDEINRLEASRSEFVNLHLKAKTALAAAEKQNAELREGLKKIADKAKRTRQCVVTGAEGESYGGLLDIESDARSLLEDGRG